MNLNSYMHHKLGASSGRRNIPLPCRGGAINIEVSEVKEDEGIMKERRESKSVCDPLGNLPEILHAEQFHGSTVHE